MNLSDEWKVCDQNTFQNNDSLEAVREPVLEAAWVYATPCEIPSSFLKEIFLSPSMEKEEK